MSTKTWRIGWCGKSTHLVSGCGGVQTPLKPSYGPPQGLLVSGKSPLERQRAADGGRCRHRGSLPTPAPLCSQRARSSLGGAFLCTQLSLAQYNITESWENLGLGMRRGLREISHLLPGAGWGWWAKVGHVDEETTQPGPLSLCRGLASSPHGALEPLHIP